MGILKIPFRIPAFKELNSLQLLGSYTMSYSVLNNYLYKTSYLQVNLQ